MNNPVENGSAAGTKPRGRHRDGDVEYNLDTGEAFHVPSGQRLQFPREGVVAVSREFGFEMETCGLPAIIDWRNPIYTVEIVPCKIKTSL